MTKDVMVRISGLHSSAVPGMTEENEAIETVIPGSYYLKNGKHYVLYEEVEEGASGVTKNKIKIAGDDTVEIIKTGLLNTHMIFEKDRKHPAHYRTPYGQMMLGIHTRNMEIAVSEKCIEVLIDYELNVDEELLEVCRIKMNITNHFRR